MKALDLLTMGGGRLIQDPGMGLGKSGTEGRGHQIENSRGLKNRLVKARSV